VTGAIVEMKPRSTRIWSIRLTRVMVVVTSFIGLMVAADIVVLSVKITQSDRPSTPIVVIERAIRVSLAITSLYLLEDRGHEVFADL